MIKHFFTRQFLLFAAVGGAAAVFHWGSRIFLSNWLPFQLAVAIAYVFGMAFAFALNVTFVFPHSSGPRLKQALNFVAVNLAFFPVVWAASILLDQWFRRMGMTHYSEAIAHGISVAIPMFATFLIYKFFTFRGGEYGRQ